MLAELQEQIEAINTQLASPGLSESEQRELEARLWEALERESDLLNQSKSEQVTEPIPEPVALPIEPDPEPQPDTVRSSPVDYLLELLETDVRLYTAELARLDQRIAEPSFAEFPEAIRARSIRSRDHLAAILDEAKADLSAYLEPVEALETQLEIENADVIEELDQAVDLAVTESALDPREIQIKTLENRIAIVQSKVDEIHAYAYYQTLKAQYMAALDRNDSSKKEAHSKLASFCAGLPESWIGNFERGTPSSSAFLLDGYKEDLAELKQKLAELIDPVQPDLASDFDVLFSEPSLSDIADLKNKAVKIREEIARVLDAAGGADFRHALTPSPEPAVLEPRPLPKPVKVEQIGTVTPTPEQLREAVLEILSHQPGFASINMLRLNLAGAPWCFDVSGDCVNIAVNTLIENGQIACDFTMTGESYRLPKYQSLSTPSEPEPANNEPRCDYCNGHMQAINGNLGQWRCLENIYHSFYVSNGRGVWVDNSGTFDKQITELPSWAKKEG